MSAFQFRKHPEIFGKHSFLSPSSYHWTNYDDDKLISTYENKLAKERGTRLHEFAEECILLGERLEDTPKTLNMFVNDSISFGLQPEIPLKPFEDAFGHADAINFDEETKTLRIFDLKTGVTPADMRQLELYAAYFCLEYGIKPSDISIELRIYQLDEIIVANPTAEVIQPLMKLTKHNVKILTNHKNKKG